MFLVDGATDLVKDQAQSAVRDSLGGELLLESVSGNPLRGYTVTRVALEKDGMLLFEADRISLAVSLLDGGARSAAVETARAAHGQAVASYRQTVLTALQEVEDNLAAAAALAQEQQWQTEAVAAARRALDVVGNQYRAGSVG